MFERLKDKQEIIENEFKELKKVKNFLNRSKDDLLLASATKKLCENEEIKLKLGLPDDYQNLFHWLIIQSYYAMYHSASAAIANKKIKAYSHIATIVSLAKKYVSSEKMDLDFIQSIEDVYINYIESGRKSRQGAQYNVEKEYTKEEAYIVFENAKIFVKRINKILEQK